ncbi:MAG: ABC transporter permease [Candidatus Omnitrophica bacterium]|nr:ABC transporter permease [Candidatus Omnitrophota bacterium]
MQLIISRFKEVCGKKDILRSLIIKNLKGRYIGSRLGFGWSILNPILLAFVISFVFTSIFRTEQPNFTCFVLSGMVPWFFFSSSINESATSVLGNSSLLNQFSIPREMFPLAQVCSNFVIFLAGLGILLPFFVISNPHIFTTFIYLPILLILYFVFTLGLSFITASTNILFRDLTHILNIGLMLWMWVTPIFYSIDSIPLSYSKFAFMNPVTPFIYLFHALLYDNKVLTGPYFLWSFIAAFGLFLMGYFIFLKLEYKFIKRM